MRPYPAPQYPALPTETPASINSPTDSFEYVRRVVMIPMRDGIKLHTEIADSLHSRHRRAPFFGLAENRDTQQRVQHPRKGQNAQEVHALDPEPGDGNQHTRQRRPDHSAGVHTGVIERQSVRQVVVGHELRDPRLAGGHHHREAHALEGRADQQVPVLDPIEREALAEELLLSIDGAERDVVDQAWLTEIRRREADFAAGKTGAKPVEQVIDRLTGGQAR